MDTKKIKVAPSILAADFSRLAEEVKRAEDSGADLLHIDVMDGHFVPNITIGPAVVSAIRLKTKLPLDTHLMIENPDKFIKSFANAGSDIITVHVKSYQPQITKGLGLSRTLRSSEQRLLTAIKQIKSLGVKAGVALNPKTPLFAIDGLLDKIDMVLLMTVNPGFSGQKFIRSVLPKIMCLRNRFDGDIEVDGGINFETAKEVITRGANILAAGTYLFKAKNMKETIEKIKRIPIKK